MDQPTFFIAPCPACAREVIGHRAIDERDALIWQCVRCDRRLDQALGRQGTPEEIESLGFSMEASAPEKRHGDSGCRDGSCGVRQPQDPTPSP